MRAFTATLCGLVLWGAVALAQMMPAGSFVQGSAVAGYVGPGDITAMTAWYGLRAYSAATAASHNKLVNIVRASDSHTCDILGASNGGFGLTGNCSSGGDNGATVPTFCNATTCSVLTKYDLTGGGRDAPFNGSASFRPSLVINCTSTNMPCVVMTLDGGGGTQFFATTANFTPGTGLLSISAVGNRSAGTTEVLWLQADGGNNRSKNTSANTHACLSTAAAVNQTASDGNWHAFACILGGAGTTTNVVDGSTTTGTLTANTTAGKIFVLQNNGSTGNVGELTEAGFQDNITWSSTTIAALHANQSAYWGTP